MTHTCQKCGIAFSDRARAKFCSAKCAGNAKTYETLKAKKAAAHQRLRARDIDKLRAKKRESVRKWRLANIDKARLNVRVRARARRIEDPTKVNAYERMIRARHPGWKALLARLIKRGVTLDQFHSKCESQDFLCAICGCDFDKLCDAVIDHHHDSGKFRGVLCVHCNIGIGHFRDDSIRLSAAAKYMERYAS